MGFKYNLVSGFFAALGAVFTKIGFNFSPDQGLIATTIIPTLSLTPSFQYPLNALFIILMLLSNALMLKYFVYAMHENGAAKATVYNFAINYLSSIMFGWAFFGEDVTLRLLCGVSFILAGTTLISTCKEKESVKIE